jgi:hypothetical protein
MIRRVLSILAGSLIPVWLFAAPIFGASVTFDGLQNGEPVLTYYDGGFGGFGSGPGPAFGVSFTAGLTADSTTIAFGPSALVQAPVTMDLDTPWSSTMSFYFTGTGSVSFYAGKDATGTLLASTSLDNSYPFGFPSGAAPGSFQSVVFSPATSGSLRVDSISFGFVVVPEPSTGMLVIAGISIVLFIRLRQNSWRTRQVT